MDSLERLLTTAITDAERIKIINRLLYYYSDVDAERSYVLGKEALRLTKQVEDPTDIATAHLNWALVAESHGQYLSSLEYNFKAMQEFQHLHDTISVSAILNNIGITYHQLGDYGSSVYYLLKAIELDESRMDTAYVGQEFINLAEAYFKAKKLNEAARCIHKAYIDLNLIDDEYSLPYATEIWSLILIAKSEYDSAANFIRLTERLADKHQNEYLLNRSLEHWGKWHFQQGNYDSAKYFLKRCITQNKNKYQSDILLPAMLTLAEIYQLQNNFPLAETQGHDAFMISKSINSVPLMVESSNLLARVYLRQQKYQQASFYLQTALAYKDSIVTVLQQSSIHGKTMDLALQREVEQKQLIASSLEKTKTTITIQRFLLILGGVVLISLLAMLWLIRRSSRERRQVNALLMQKNVELSNLNREVNGLIDAIVHDLKSPLNSLQGILYLVEEEVKDNKTAKEFISKGNQVIRNGHDIIKQLLELKELEDAPMTLRYENVKLPDFVQSITNEFRAYAQQKKINIVEHVSDEAITLDTMMIKRIMDNLLSNAIKFSPLNRKVEITATTTDTHVVFEVRDEGPGFQQQDIPKVFGRFQKLSARPTGGESSHGLGLAIVHLIVKTLGGHIELKTLFGMGATFIVTLPLIRKP